MGDPHILVVDDDRDMLRMLETVLSLDGFRVSVSDNGDEGLRKALEEQPDLVVLDVMMPGKSGLEVMREMRSDPRGRDIPILFLSAWGDETIVVQGLKGADDYVLKPFKPLELESRIRKILERAGKGGEGRPVPEARPFDRLPVKLGEETYLVPLKDIFYLAASGKYCYAHTRNRRFLTGCSIGELEEKLRGDVHFLRINRSYMVNIEHIFKMTRDEQRKPVIVVADEGKSELRVGESYLQSVKERMGI